MLCVKNDFLMYFKIHLLIYILNHVFKIFCVICLKLYFRFYFERNVKSRCQHVANKDRKRTMRERK